MKKALVIIALIAMVVVPVAAKKSVGAIGLEAGAPSGITFNYDLEDKWDGYATVGFGFVGGQYIDVVIGGQYKVDDFKIDKAKFDVNVGLQAGADIFLGESSGFAITVRGTASVSYDFKIKDVGDFTTYLRLAGGVGIGLGNEVNIFPSWVAALGLVYHI